MKRFVGGKIFKRIERAQMVDDKITLSEEYADFESRHNRHLNML